MACDLSSSIFLHTKRSSVALHASLPSFFLYESLLKPAPDGLACRSPLGLWIGPPPWHAVCFAPAIHLAPILWAPGQPSARAMSAASFSSSYLRLNSSPVLSVKQWKSPATPAAVHLSLQTCLGQGAPHVVALSLLLPLNSLQVPR